MANPERPAPESRARPASTLWGKVDAWLRETGRTILFVAVVVVGVRTVVFEPFNIPSGSMLPTLLVGDFLVVSKFSYGYSEHSITGARWLMRQVAPGREHLFQGRILGRVPTRGDVAVFKLPSDPSIDYIKRIVGLPGDRIQVKGGILHINGEAVRRDPDGRFDESGRGFGAVQRYVETLPGGRRHHILEMSDNGWLDNTPEITVPQGHVFGMGDNRDNSQDSRVFGPIPLDNLVGRAEFLFFSVTEDAQLLRPWTWYNIRFGRLLDAIDSDVPAAPRGAAR